MPGMIQAVTSRATALMTSLSRMNMEPPRRSPITQPSSGPARNGAHEGTDQWIGIHAVGIDQGAADAAGGFDSVQDSHIVRIRHSLEPAVLPDDDIRRLKRQARPGDAEP